MPFSIVCRDITKVKVDAIVNAANESLLGGGGVDGAIHRAAGPELLMECRKLGGCKTGEAKITGGYWLPSKYVIHTVGPVWQGGGFGERQLLESCYRKSLELAKKQGCESVAFPLISAGVYGYPKEAAIAVAVDTIRCFLQKEDMTVFLVVFQKKDFLLPDGLLGKVRDYLTSRELGYHKAMMAPCAAMPCSLDDALGQIDESFTQMVRRKIRELGIKNAECYKRANLDKKLFSKLINDDHYKPKKTTAVALAIALRLDLAETRELLMKAGFALSRSEKFDIIIEFFLQSGNYDIFEINEVLFHYDQPLLGSIIY